MERKYKIKMPKHHQNGYTNDYYVLCVCLCWSNEIPWTKGTTQKISLRKTSQRINSIQTEAHWSHTFPMKWQTKRFFFSWTEYINSKGATTWHFVSTWIAFQLSFSLSCIVCIIDGNRSFHYQNKQCYNSTRFW